MNEPVGADVYFKWKPINQARTFASLTWQTEYFPRQIPSRQRIANIGFGRGLDVTVVFAFLRETKLLDLLPPGGTEEQVVLVQIQLF